MCVVPVHTHNTYTRARDGDGCGGVCTARAHNQRTVFRYPSSADIQHQKGISLGTLMCVCQAFSSLQGINVVWIASGRGYLYRMTSFNFQAITPLLVPL